ncbi:MAG: RES domain-containing protein [Bacteroidetes bacterium]|nr:RES domain-containing protein [Bacteroidota bacterium]
MLQNPYLKYDIERVNDILSKLSSLDLHVVDYSEVYQCIDDIFTEVVFKIIRCPVTPIFRARKNNNTSFLKMDDLIFPKADLIENFGRLSKPHCPVFYASSSGDIAVFEIQPNDDDILTIVQFQLKPQFIYIQSYKLGESSNVFQNNSQSLNNEGNYSPEYMKIVERIHSFFTEQFLVIIDANEGDKYKITAAISEILFLKNDFAECLIYPSVAANMEGFNVGIKPDVFISKYKPTGIAEYKIVKKDFSDDAKEYVIVCIKKAEKILDNGVIKW